MTESVGDLLARQVKFESHHVRDCPFCDSKNLNLCVTFSDTIARIECNSCNAKGPYAAHESKQIAIYDAINAWNGIVTIR